MQDFMVALMKMVFLGWLALPFRERSVVGWLLWLSAALNNRIWQYNKWAQSIIQYSSMRISFASNQKKNSPPQRWLGHSSSGACLLISKEAAEAHRGVADSGGPAVQKHVGTHAQRHTKYILIDLVCLLYWTNQHHSNGWTNSKTGFGCLGLADWGRAWHYYQLETWILVEHEPPHVPMYLVASGLEQDVRETLSCIYELLEVVVHSTAALGHTPTWPRYKTRGSVYF